MNDGVNNPEELALQLHDIARKLRAAGRNDLILSALGSSMLDELKSEAVRGHSSIFQNTRMSCANGIARRRE